LKFESKKIDKVDKKVWIEITEIKKLDKYLRKEGRALLVLLKKMKKFSKRLDWNFKRVDASGHVISKSHRHHHGWSEHDDKEVKEYVTYK